MPDIRHVRMLLILAALPWMGVHLFRDGGHRRGTTAFETIDLGGLPELRSRNGVLEAILTAAPLQVHIGGAVFEGAGYNGSYGGPVLRVKPGDELRLHLVNKMPSAINLHFHGLRVTPEGRGDNMHILVPPGGRFDYDMRIPPGHPPGLFWYHDHAFEAAEQHVTAGLSGALLIDGFAAQFTGLGTAPQQLLVLKDWSQPGCQGALLKTQLHCRIVSINGQEHWTDTLAPGQPQLWRISNQGSDLILHLAAPGLSLRIVGRDGLPAFDAPIVDRIDIMPAARLDVLVVAAAAGHFPLSATGIPTGSGDAFSIKRELGSITAVAPGAAPPVAILARNGGDLRGAKIDARRLIVFSENTSSTAFMINGRLFDPARTDFIIPLGSVEEWTVRNTTPDFHVFHIHQLGFQVIDINGKAQNFTGFVDGVRVPEHGEVKLLIPFTDPEIVGHIMFHCHVLLHEDHGMMARVEVVRPGLFRICRYLQ
jgi:FtsP/CotA-like multicopper oxidase with cupredoxin domain